MAKGQLSGVTKEQLAALYADKSTYQIGLIFGCNEEAVRKKLIADWLQYCEVAVHFWSDLGWAPTNHLRLTAANWWGGVGSSCDR